MADTHKVRIKIGDAEFEAEGSEESVKLQFESFLAALAAQKAAVPVNPAAGGGTGNDKKDDPAPDLTGGGAAGAGGAGQTMEKSVLDRAFAFKDGVVSLRILPQTESRESDTLLMLVYGYAALKGEDMVLGTQLIKAARVSGLTLDRIDRAISRHDGFLLKGGARKGLKYGLNNPGKLHAEGLIRRTIT